MDLGGVYGREVEVQDVCCTCMFEDVSGWALGFML